jgi:hypothetical protein
MLLNDHWVIEEVRKDIFKILEFNENQNMTHQKLKQNRKTSAK